MGDKTDPQSGHVFKSLSCCLTFIDWLGVATTIFVVGVGRILGVEAGAATGLTLCCVPVTLCCATLAADLPPHAPHPIIVSPFSHQYAGRVLVDVFALLASGCLLAVLLSLACLSLQP